MTAPRTAREYRPAGWEPRHGVRRALVCWALAWAIALAALALWHSQASGEAMPFPPSVPLRTPAGETVCRATPMGLGHYSAAHCGQRFGTLIVAKTHRAPWSMDASSRDLAHYATGSVTVTMRAAAYGERLRWSNDRNAGTVYVVRVGPVIEFALGEGGRFTWGDSGSGLWGDDGALVGILTDLYHDGAQGRYGNPTGGGEAVQVP